VAEPPRHLRLAPSTSPPPPDLEKKSADYNVRILWPVARYLEDKHGAPALTELANVAGLVPEDFGGKNSWVSAVAFEALLAHFRSLLQSDDEFRVACAYRIAEAYGPLRYVLWATSPAAIYQQAVKTYPIVSTVGVLSVPSAGRGRLHMRVEKDSRDLPFTRLNCLVRQAQCAALPTLWGLPHAYVTETACIANGDPTCELFFRWYDRRRWLPAVLGGAAGAGVAFASSHGMLPDVSASAAMVLSGFLLGYLFELRATERINEGTKHEVLTALREIATQEAEARREILDLNKRQKDWTSLLEEEAALRAATMARVAERVDELQNARTTTVLGFSHDLKNPLQIIRMSIDYLRDSAELGTDGADVVRDLDHSVSNMQRMLEELMQVVTSQRSIVQRAPQRLEVMPLVDRLRRRLTALVLGKRIKVTVITNREAPEAIEIDPIVFDRIVDNLLTNAAKYTERGSIVVDLDGTPGFLVIKVSDTGRGIAADDLERTFLAGGSDPKTRGQMSWGIGLSVVVQLLDGIGGRLEVISKPNEGTTFWVHLPTEQTTAKVINQLEQENQQKIDPGALSRVVKIRKVLG
jgi:signal transduction histidine kinase